jgi:hypothetical protein
MAIGGEPLVHFVHWNTPLDLNEDYVGFPEDNEAQYVDSDRLVRWPVPDGNPPAWMFSIRLTAINSEGDVEQIVQAMMALLRKPTDTDQALPSKFPGLVHYCMEGKSLKISG